MPNEGQLVRTSGWHSEDPPSSPGSISMSFLFKVYWYSSCPHRFVEKLLFLMPGFHGVFRSMCLEVLHPQADIRPNFYRELKDKGFHTMLTHRYVMTGSGWVSNILTVFMSNRRLIDELCSQTQEAACQHRLDVMVGNHLPEHAGTKECLDNWNVWTNETIPIIIIRLTHANV